MTAAPGGVKVVKVMDLLIHDLDFEETIDAVRAALIDRRSMLVATLNVDHAVLASRDPACRDVMNAMDLRVPDGVWIGRAARLAGRPLLSAITGRLLIPSLAAVAAENDFPIALVGGPPGVARRAAERLMAAHPGLRISLATAPPMGFVIGSEADRRLIDEVAACDARLVFVGLGAPLQEAWMLAHRERLEGRVVAGIGAGLDISAGRFRAAPEWMTRIGMEWAFRLAQEPRRLWRRYLIDDPTIFWWAVQSRLGAIGRGRSAG